VIGMSNNKFHAEKVEIDNIKFDSKRESQYYRHFVDMANAGIVAKIEVHPRYILLNSFKDCNGKTERAITYKPDFRITYADGTIEVVEVKGKRTAKEPDYIMRRKLFKHNNPNVKFSEVF
jgi:hypothetical protein